MDQAIIRGTLESFEEATPSVRRLFIRIEDPIPFLFTPGQYVAVRVPGSGSPVFRPYSIASGPDSTRRIELCFKHVEGGTASQYLCSCTAGAHLELRGPAGNFTLADTPRPNTLFVATGTGISPIRSMLQFLFRRGFNGPSRLLFGARQKIDILYREEFEQLQERNPGFRFLPTLSRPDAGWQGLAGHVQDHIRPMLAGSRVLEAYICGHQAMVKEVRSILEEGGLTEEHIHYEKYVSA